MSTDSLDSKLAQESVNIGLVNPKSASNVAVIMRAAGCFGVDAVYYTGERYEFAKKYANHHQEDTKNVRHRIPNTSVTDLYASRPKGSTVVAVELTVGATPLPEFEHPQNAFYIFGPEDGSISNQLLQQCDHVVYIPTQASLNLGMTANIVLYDRLAKGQFDESEQLIELARDKNNNTKI